MKKILILLLTSSFLLSNNWFRGLENPNGPTGELTVSFRDVYIWGFAHNICFVVWFWR